jgi:hypothetical protein
MSETIGYTKVKKSRKDHTCYWCGELIAKGSPYARWAWVDDGISTTKVHPECEAAWGEIAAEEGGYYEAMPYDNERPLVSTLQDAMEGRR